MFGFTKLFAVAAVLATSVVAAPIESAEVEKRTMHSGQATYFEVGLGACGWTNVNTDMIVALNSAQYQSNNGANCGQWMTITNTANGKKAKAFVADECPTCDNGSLDMSPTLFQALSSGGLDQGVFPISWKFNKRN